MCESRTDTPEFLSPPPSYATENYTEDPAHQNVQHSHKSGENQLNSSFQYFQKFSSSEHHSKQERCSQSTTFHERSSQQNSFHQTHSNEAGCVTPIELLDEMSWNLTRSASGNQEILQSPVIKRQKTSRSKYSRDSLAELDAQITDIQTQFEAELDNLIRIAGTISNSLYIVNLSPGLIVNNKRTEPYQP